MNGTDVLTIDGRTGDLGDSIDGIATPMTSMTSMVDARFRASLSPLAFQMGHMGARLGWHGSVAAYSPSTQIAGSP